MTKKQHYFLCGIGGTGMSALANILCAQGHKVSGSDRSRDQGKFSDLFAQFEQMGVTLYPQDGSGVTTDIDTFLTSTAVEDSVPDKRAALDQGITIKTRPELLAEWLNSATRGITISGTSGKSTVTGMAGKVFTADKQDPTVICGAPLRNDYHQGKYTGLGNTINGSSLQGTLIAEADESNGTLVDYTPKFSVITNITLDHKPLEELKEIFRIHCHNVKERIVFNLDDPESQDLIEEFQGKAYTVSLNDKNADMYATDIEEHGFQSSFTIHHGEDHQDRNTVTLVAPGRHNISNALCVLGLAKVAGLDVTEAAASLEAFLGLQSRLEITGQSPRGAEIIDDYAHNPDKVRASLSALHKAVDGRLIVLFQPHGFGPTRLMKEGYIEAFSNNLRKQDLLLISEIFYAGGTADQSISSQELVDGIKQNDKRAEYCENLEQAEQRIDQLAELGDTVVIMGARNKLLRELAHRLPDTLILKEERDTA